MAWMEQGFDATQEMRSWISPSLIEANHILSLSQQDLQALIEQEMSQNPALELENRATCPVCMSVLDGAWCPTCQRTVEVQRREESLDAMDEYEVPSAPSAPADSSDDFDPMTIVASDVSPLEQLHTDARMSLHEDDYATASMIIDSLDERGFLTMSLDEIAEPLGISVDDVEEVLGIIQNVAPVGVGARNLSECLVLQVEYLRQLGTPIPPYTDDVVRDYLDEFGAHKYGQIQKKLGISADELDDIREFIRAQLNPFPLQSHANRSWQAPNDDGHVTPDVIIEIVDDNIQIAIADNHFFHLRTNALYSQLMREFSTRKAREEPANNRNDVADDNPSEDTIISREQIAESSSEDKQHVRRFAQRAQTFMSNIEQRQSTLLRISECICRFQEAFLREGVRELRPLTRALVAQEVGVHESTVSRATANKFVQLPNRKVIPFSDFFTANLSAKEVIKQIIERENAKGESLTDKRIVELLQDEGIRIARRTVAKYRAELGILPSTMR